LCGGHKYTQGTRIGNWWEDVESKETQTKDYMHSKNADKLAVNAMQSKQAIANQPVNHTFREDGSIQWEDHIVMKSLQMNGALVMNTNDRIAGNDESFGVTVSTGKGGAIARSIMVLERGDEKDGAPDNCVHYGQKVRIRSNQWVYQKPLYLSST
jgi:hypothetical protein